jgi:hypothetical protein
MKPLSATDNAILEMWFAKARRNEIAERCHVTTTEVEKCIKRGRYHGDARADRRTGSNEFVSRRSSERAAAIAAVQVEITERRRMEDTPLLCPELGIESVSRIVPNRQSSWSTVGVDGLDHVTVSVPRVRFLEEACSA